MAPFVAPDWTLLTPGCQETNQPGMEAAVPRCGIAQSAEFDPTEPYKPQIVCVVAVRHEKSEPKRTFIAEGPSVGELKQRGCLHWRHRREPSWWLWSLDTRPIVTLKVYRSQFWLRWLARYT